MSDIYHIPNDNGKDYRLNKFVEYQHEVPSIHYRFLGKYIKKHGFNKDTTVNFCFLMSVTYNELTCLLLHEMLKVYSPEEIWKRYKQKLSFGSARKYAKNNDQFVDLINQWNMTTNNMPFEWLNCQILPSEEQTCVNIQRNIQNINNVGRFASDLFIEMLVYLKEYLGIKIKEPTTIDWGNCANLTSGIFNIFYEDEKANEFDKTKKVTPLEIKYLSSKLSIIQKSIQKTYPEQDSEISMFIGKICSFRNLFKNARYGGFHHDRQLGVLKQYEIDFPEYDYLWKECYDLRQQIFPKRFLGELNGWDGIRKERKKIWLTTGKTGVEYDNSDTKL